MDTKHWHRIQRYLLIGLFHTIRAFLPKAFLVMPVILIGVGIFATLLLLFTHMPGTQLSEALIKLIPVGSVDEDSLFNLFMIAVFLIGVIMSGLERILKRDFSAPVWRGSSFLILISLVLYIVLFVVFGESEMAAESRNEQPMTKWMVGFLILVVHVFALFQMWVYFCADLLLSKLIQVLVKDASAYPSSGQTD